MIQTNEYDNRVVFISNSSLVEQTIDVVLQLGRLNTEITFRSGVLMFLSMTGLLCVAENWNSMATKWR